MSLIGRIIGSILRIRRGALFETCGREIPLCKFSAALPRRAGPILKESYRAERIGIVFGNLADESSHAIP
jgi:hypothetical protein